MKELLSEWIALFPDLTHQSSTSLPLPFTRPHSFTCPLLVTEYREAANKNVWVAHLCFQNPLLGCPEVHKEELKQNQWLA